MIVHFICRGNAFRSRMAEAYFNSLDIKGVEAISSGSVADLHSQSNKLNFEITKKILDKHGLSRYTKSHWDQLTQERLDKANLTVFMNQAVADECKRLFKLPANMVVWGVPDFDEVTPVPRTGDEINSYAERTYLLVAESVNKLVQKLN
jgi:protein-tyrosine-phosphatase